MLKDRKVNEWFKTFDKNHSGVLERDQLRELLIHLNPSTPPDESALDLLMEKATAIDTTGDGVADTKGARPPPSWERHPQSCGSSAGAQRDTLES